MEKNTKFNTIESCLACKSTELFPLLDFGSQPLANNLICHTDPYPLKVNLCKTCYHMQLSIAVDPKDMFDDYLYVSGTTNTLKKYFDWFANFAAEYNPSAHNVLDIACNDGTQLDSFKNIGIKTYGIDPAKNLFELSSKNHSVICDYFNEKTASILKQKFDIIVAQNVVAHTSSPIEFLSGCKKIMHKDSLLFIQTSQANMVLNNEFDTIYHEHISFFSLNSMINLARQAGLYVIDAIKTPIHGTSWVFVIAKKAKNQCRMQNLLNMEKESGLHTLDRYIAYSKNCIDIQNQLKKTLRKFRKDGYVIVGYGAAAKGMTLLNSIDEKLDAIVDDNPLKQNTLSPGNLTPIVSSKYISEIAIDKQILFVPLAWNFFNEIQNKIKNIRNSQNDKFILYFPEIKVI